MTVSARKESAQQILAQAYEREIRDREREINQRLGDGLRTYEPTVRQPVPSDWGQLIDSWRKRLRPHEE
jgi:hypothetical protein